MTPDHRCEIEAAKNHSIIDRLTALALGMSASAIARRLETGRWRVVYPGVYFVGAGEITWKARLVAACAWAGPGAVVSHIAAAQLHGLFTSRNQICVSVPKRVNSRHGVKVHWAPAGCGRTSKIDGIPVTCIERTIIDMCRSATRRFAIEIVERAIRRKRTNLKRLDEFLQDEETKPCPTLSWVLRNRFALGVTDSEAEDLYIRITKKRPATRGWVHHHVLTRNGYHLFELDFAYLLERLNIEIDGEEHHSGPVAGPRDKRRDALVKGMGWEVLRFTYWQLVDEPDWVLDRVEETLAHRRRRQLHT
jgi:hypothetical protein